MFFELKKFSTSWFAMGLFLVAIFALGGCAAPVKTLNPDVKTPQLIVNPEIISLGVDKLMNKTDIVFEGAGFRPKDSVFVSLIGNGIDTAIASGQVGADGTFKARVETIAKLTTFLRAAARSSYTKEGKQLVTLVLTQPSIPPGEYTARAVSMLSNEAAETKIILREPSFTESIVDKLGGLLGKIEDKRP